MSYELLFKSKNKKFTYEDFINYFSSLPYYLIQGNNKDQAWYSNPNTEVYFDFCYEAQNVNQEDNFLDENRDEYEVKFYINSARPHYFALEAAMEIESFLENFSFELIDPQIDGMTVYSREAFLKGWMDTNRLFYQSNQQINSEVISLIAPTRLLEKIWQWNYHLPTRQKLLGDTIFVPRIDVASMDKEIVPLIVWSDAMAIAIPDFIKMIALFSFENHEQGLEPIRYLHIQEIQFLLNKFECIQENIIDYYLLQYETPPEEMENLFLDKFNLPNNSPPNLLCFGNKNHSILNAEVMTMYR